KEALNKLQGNLQRVRQSIFNLKNAFIGLGASVVIKGFVDAGIQIENLEVQLKALFGSAKEGKKALKAVTDFAAGTPFELKNIQQGITALATVRKRAEENGVSFEELLKITGNTATVLGGDFALAALQIQRSFSAGIGSAELFRERGVRAMAGFKEGVQVSVDGSIQGLKKAFGTGGEYGRLLNDLSQTLFGTISNLKDAFFIFQTEVAQGFFGALKKNLGDLKSTVEANRNEIAEFGNMIGTGLSAAIQATAKTVKFLKENMDLIIEAFKILIAFKLVRFFYNLTTAITAAAVAMRGFNAATKANMIIGGAALLISQLDKIIEKLREIGLLEKPKFTDFPKPHEGMTISKIIPEATLIDKLKMQIKLFGVELENINKTKVKEMEDKFKNIGALIATGLSQAITKFSDAFARAVVLGENLADAMKRLRQEFAVKLLSALIDYLARKSVEYTIEKLITKEKEKQVALQKASFLSSFTSPFGFLSGFTNIFRASGGAVQKGKPYMVGEKGAEMFIPNQTGQITQAARGTDGKAVNVTFNINTVDASGFDDLLVRSRGTITQLINSAVNERGERDII
ncbi:MAG TPA: hypothetical protein VLB82_03535, partial [Thermodesulfobacteriota bacterium]|nr:hypothetical protein [Thermodesulfobacteriota bacterium]